MSETDNREADVMSVSSLPSHVVTAETLMSLVCHLPLLVLQCRWEAFSDLLNDIHADLQPFMEPLNAAARKR